MGVLSYTAKFQHNLFFELHINKIHLCKIKMDPTWKAFFYFTVWFIKVWKIEASVFILNTTSGSFKHPKNSSRYQPATEHTWLIKVEKARYINLSLHIRDVEVYRGKCIDIVEIKDGDSSHAPFLGGYCNENKPSYNILSSGNALRVWFQSAKNSAGGHGFSVTYTSALDEACGGHFKTFPGVIKTPRYPLPYPNNRECTWTIQTPPGTYIRVQFHGAYGLEYRCPDHHCECVDFLEIRDGGIRLREEPQYGYCFMKPEPFTSRSNAVEIKFTSDSHGRYEGFHFTYTTSLTRGCGGDIHKDRGILTSPNYPYSYYSYIKCIWRIKAPKDHFVTITFHEFDVERSSSFCAGHFLTIRDGYSEESPLLEKMCTPKFVKEINSTGEMMHITFMSFFNSHSMGFRATFASHRRT
ncbi:cubilin-like [Xenia sp. Carnegie-2017]|uniref:cubilin-like n=1 Tax=Xenia sp. Carnegie-2017 TaxID=2897299 RepID=UPI001F045BFE|nr:cubilin-like [Xenia sp. Carnegie-2017]